MSSLLKHQNSKKLHCTSSKPPYKSISVSHAGPLTGPDLITTTYESIGSNDTLDYMNPKASLIGSSSNTYTYMPDTPSKEGFAETNFSSVDDVPYHGFEPNVQRCATDGTSNGFTAPSHSPPSVPARNSKRHAAFYHMLDGVLEDSSMCYECPTISKFRVRYIFIVRYMYLL